MAEERDDPVPTDDPRDSETSEQNAEQTHPGAAPATAERGDGGDGGRTPDAPSTSHEQEGDAGQATGNPDAAG
jgi:hypothetical protein